MTQRWLLQSKVNVTKRKLRKRVAVPVIDDIKYRVSRSPENKYEIFVVIKSLINHACR